MGLMSIVIMMSSCYVNIGTSFTSKFSGGQSAETLNVEHCQALPSANWH